MEYVIILLVLLIILLAVLKANKKDAGLDFNKLVEYDINTTKAPIFIFPFTNNKPHIRNIIGFFNFLIPDAINS